MSVALYKKAAPWKEERLGTALATWKFEGVISWSKHLRPNPYRRGSQLYTEIRKLSLYSFFQQPDGWYNYLAPALALPSSCSSRKGSPVRGSTTLFLKGGKQVVYSLTILSKVMRNLQMHPCMASTVYM